MSRMNRCSVTFMAVEARVEAVTFLQGSTHPWVLDVPLLTLDTYNLVG